MISQCSLNSKDEMRQWDGFVKSHPDGTPFHLHNWIKTIYESYNFEPYLYAVKDNRGIITSILPLFLIKSIFTGNRIISLPFTDFCGPLCSNLEEEKELLKNVLATFGTHVRHLEIRSVLTGNDTFIYDEFYKHHVLSLEHGASELFNKFDKKTIQYSIRKAQKSDVEIREENNAQGMEAFFELNKMTRKKHGVPHQPRYFFENIFNNMFSDNGAFLLLARSNARVIAGGLFFKMNGTIHYKYNASDQEFLAEKRPNHLLTWHAIERACLEHYDFFDFGRTSRCNSGLMRYKEMWGAQAIDLPYYHYPKVKGLSCGKTIGSSSMEKLTRIWQRLPDSMVDFVSNRIYRHLA
jgi:lipid II:glycine glycyltransferase (peptidoglycan interpeptide bridge formation enzyme)